MLPGLASAIVGVVGGGVAGIQFVGGAVAGKVGASSGTSTIALNSGLTGGISASAASGDFVIAAFATGSSADRTLSITDGGTDYTLIGSELYESDTQNINLRVAYKFITSDTDTTFGPTGNAADAGAMAVYVFRGVNATTPLDATPTTATAQTISSGVGPNPPSITPVTAGAFIVCVGGYAHAGGTQTLSSSDLTDFLTVGANDTYDACIGIGHKDDWTSGAFNAGAFGFSGTLSGGNTSAAISIALRPA